MTTDSGAPSIREVLTAIALEGAGDTRDDIERDALSDPNLPALERDIVLVIQGVRRCGKSTLMRQIAAREGISERAVFVNFEDPRLSDRLDHTLLDDIVRTHEHRSKRNTYYFFDEIQNVKGWEKWLHVQLEQRKRHFVVSGSNANLLGGKLGTALTGRHLTYELFPFSFAEFRKVRPRASLEDYLQQGGFPRPLLGKRPEPLLRQYFTDIIERDVRQHVGARSSVALAQIAKTAFESMGSELSLRNIAKAFGTTADTVKTYVQAFEAAYLTVSCPFFAYSERVSQVHPRKYYPIDLGLRRSVVTRSGYDLGKSLECAVLHHLRRSYRTVYYWHGKGEVDFVVQTPDGLIPIQISVGDEKTRHIAAVEEFARVHRGALAPKFIDMARAEKLLSGRKSLEEL